MNRFALVLLAFTVSAILSGCDAGSSGSATGPKPASKGIEEAQKDIAAGKLAYREQPIPAPAWYGRYYELLREKGIEPVVVDHADAKLSADDATYNQTMRAEIEKKHGANIMQKLLTQAKSEWEAKVKAKQPAPPG